MVTSYCLLINLVMPILEKSTQALILWSHLFTQVLPRKNQLILLTVSFIQVHVAWCCSAHTHAPFVVLRPFKELIFFFPRKLVAFCHFDLFKLCVFIGRSLKTCSKLTPLSTSDLKREFVRTLSSAFHTWTARFSEVNEKWSKFLALLPIPTGPEVMNRRFLFFFF